MKWVKYVAVSRIMWCSIVILIKEYLNKMKLVFTLEN